jgi:hypothetical protein
MKHLTNALALGFLSCGRDVRILIIEVLAARIVWI